MWGHRVSHVTGSTLIPAVAQAAKLAAMHPEMRAAGGADAIENYRDRIPWIPIGSATPPELDSSAVRA